jgi:dihydrofolate reductase
MSRIVFVVAVARNGVIGRNGGLPWRIPSDLKRFKEITMGKPVIMGRKTWDSLPRRPLPGRLNIVISTNPDFEAAGAMVVGDADAALSLAQQEKAEEIAVIGGAAIFDMFMPSVDRLYLTEVDLAPQGDVWFPPFDPAEWTEISREHHAQEPGDNAAFTLRVLDRRKSAGPDLAGA